MKNFKTRQSRLDDLKRRSELIKESFQKEFNKIKRIDEAELTDEELEALAKEDEEYENQATLANLKETAPINEGNEKDYTEQVTLSNGVEYKVYIHPFKQWTSDTIDRYSIYVKNRGITEQDIQTLFGLVADKHPTLVVGKVNRHDAIQTEVIVWSSDESIHSQL